MNTKSLSFFLPLFVLTHSLDDLHASNISVTHEFRQPRVTGRIVKVYSGTRPQPIICPGEGFQPDPVDCSVFYRCVISTHGKYTSFRFQCSPGTIYDPDSEVCNFPQSTRRSECGGMLAQFLPRHYKNELDNAKYELPSPIRNVPYFEETATKSKESTVNPFSATSKRQAIHSTFSSALPWMQTTLYQTPKPSKSLSATHSSNSQRGDPCTIDGFLGDSEDCRKFYRCVGNFRGGFIRYEFICSDNTIWDEDAKSCNHAWAVKRRRCGHGDTPKRTSSYLSAQSIDEDNQTIQQQLQVNYGSKVTQTQTQISNGSGVLQNQTQINYGDRVDNKRESSIKQNQTQISHGSAVSQTQTQINYGNKGSQTQLQIDHTKEASQSQTQIQHDSEQSTVSSSVLPSHENASYASNECTQSGFMGDKKDCKKFYRCVDNGKGSYTKYEFSCGEGTVWDSNIEGCNHAWAVKNCGGNSPSSSNSLNNQSLSTTSAITSTQNYHTTSRPVTDDEEEIDNSYGNQNPTTENNLQQPSSTTLASENKPTSETIVSENNQCSQTGFVGDKNDCKKFYRCVDNGRGTYIKYEFKCGEGTVWDPEIEACNHAWAVMKCGGSNIADNTYQIETTTNKNTAVTTVTLIQTTTETSELNSDDEIGYGQQQNPSTTTTTTKYPDTENTNKCKSSGFIGDKDNCKKFYRCVDSGNGAFTRYEFSCGEGTVWDPKIEACNHPWAVEHCGEDKTDLIKETTTVKVIDENASSSTESQTISTSSKEPSTTTVKSTFETQCKREGFAGDNNDCKKFYRCVDNGRGGFIKYEFTCGEGTVWDPEISTCNYPTPNHSCSGIGSEVSNTDVEKEDDEMYTETTTIKSSSSTEYSVSTASITNKPQTVDKTCKSEGFYSDPDNCKKFYRCVNNGNGGYTKYEFTCGDGTVWDQDIQGCNHASENKNCPPNDSSLLQSTTEITLNTSTSQTQQENSTTKPEPSSNDHCTSEGFYANSKDCKKFYRCVDNGKGGYTKYDFSCGEGTIWIQDLQTCDHDNGISNCSEINVSGTQEASNVEETTAASSTIPSKENDEYPSEAPNDSPSSQEKCTAEGFYPNVNDCTRFYRCVDNGNGGFTKYDFTCGEGTAWDQNLQTCNHKDEVQNCRESNHSKPEEYDEETTVSSTTKTSTSGSTTESSKPGNKETCEQEGYYGNKDDCKKFYRCVDNGKGGFTQYDFTCGEGTIWDQDLTTCNHPQDVKNPSCEQNGSSSTSSSSSSTSSTISNIESSSGVPQNNGNCSQDESSKKPSNKDVNCTKEGFYADPNDCKKFYRCVDWDGEGQKFSVFHFECGEGTIWDPALDTCNHEDSVYPPRDCSGSQSQSESSNQESTESMSTTQEESTTSQDNSTTTTQAITEEQATTQQSTTQKQTTTEQTTTQQSTTNQQTTQQSTTSEQTTVQQTTTEQTTTQKSTTNQQTTPQSTTSEQTTVQQTTTQQSTTNQQTTQQSTTSEQTTAQETTTSEQTTIQQSTTSLQTTTQQSTTNEPSTTKKTTEQTTTEQSTTESEDITTQKSTTSEESTTQISTTEQTTAESTMDSSTTDQQTTSQSNETTEPTSSATEQQTESSTTEQESTTENGTTESSLQEKECPETEDDQYLFVCPTSFRRHPKYCNLFYQCEEDADSHEVKIAVFKCPNETIYDETQTKCVEKDKADKKCNGEMAKKRRIKRFDTVYKEPVTVSRTNFSCPAIGNFPLEKEECSPAFLKCQTSKSGKFRGLIYQCPEGYLYWSISKRCEQQSNIKFCKKSKTTMYRRWEIPVERKNVAK